MGIICALIGFVVGSFISAALTGACHKGWSEEAAIKAGHATWVPDGATGQPKFRWHSPCGK